PPPGRRFSTERTPGMSFPERLERALLGDQWRSSATSRHPPTAVRGHRRRRDAVEGLGRGRVARGKRGVVRAIRDGPTAPHGGSPRAIPHRPSALPRVTAASPPLPLLTLLLIPRSAALASPRTA